MRLHRPQNITLDTVLLIDRLVVSDSVNGLKAGDPLLLTFNDDGTLAAMRTVRSTEGPTVDGRSTIHFDAIDPRIAATIQLLIKLVQKLQPFVSTADAPTLRVIQGAQDLLISVLLDHEADPSEWADDIARNSFESAFDPAVADLLDQLQQEVGEILKVPPGPAPPVLSSPEQFVTALLKPRETQVANRLQLRRDLGRAFKPGADTAAQLLVNFVPQLRDTYYTAWAGANVNGKPRSLVGVFALRTNAALFGAGVQRQAFFNDNGGLAPQSEWPEWDLDTTETKDGVFLDQLHTAIAAPGLAVVKRMDNASPGSQVYKVRKATTAQRAAYGISGKTTHLQFDRNWWNANTTDMDVLRSTLVWAQSEPLTLADEPITEPVGHPPASETRYDRAWRPLQGAELGPLGDPLRRARRHPRRHRCARGRTADDLGPGHGYDPNLAGATSRTPRCSLRPTRLCLQPRHAHDLRQCRRRRRTARRAPRCWAAATRRPALADLHAEAAAADLHRRRPRPPACDSTLAVYVDDVVWHETDDARLRSDRRIAASSRSTDDDGEHHA